MRKLIPLALFIMLAASAQAQIAVRGGIVYTMDGEPITDGVVVITDGKIKAVGPANKGRIPDGYEILDAAVVTPGLVDVHSTVGLTGILNVPHDQDHIERSAPIQPELRAVDAYNPQEPLVAWVRSFGVTTVHTGHSDGAPISGQTMIVKTRGTTVADATVQEATALAVTLTPPSAIFGNNTLFTTRAKTVSLLRQELIKAQEYRDKQRRAEKDDEVPAPDRNLHLETLVQVLDGDLALMVTAHRARDMVNAMRLAEEFDLRLWLDGASEAHQILPMIKAADVPVLIHPTMMRSFAETENASMESAALLKEAGIAFGIQSGYEAYVPKVRVVLLEAGVAAAHGLGFEDALAAITIEPARILGIDKKVGSLKKGKDGDLALYDGDPFEYTTHCVGVVIEGEVVSTTIR